MAPKPRVATSKLVLASTALLLLLIGLRAGSVAADLQSTEHHCYATPEDPRIDVLRPMFSTVDVWIENGIILAYEDTDVELLAVGHGLTANTKLTLTTESNKRGDYCTIGVLSEYYVFHSVYTDEDGNVSAGVISMRVPSVPEGESHFYLCLVVEKTITDDDGEQQNTTFLIHQGDKVFLMMDSKAKLIPLWLHCVFLVFFLILSALFSGLNLGLMSLDITELKVLQNCGTESEKKYAKAISPVRKRGNYLLCTLLFGNVLVNSCIAIFLGELGGGLIAVITSTICIVVFGEIIPQALCSRHGLSIGAKTIVITKLFMVLTFPVSFPVSKLLDLILGKEIGQVYNREKLQELVKLADKQDIKNEEINIIQGALLLTKKTAVNVMTPIEDVFMVDYHAILDYSTMSLIMNTGYTRVPIYDGDRSNIVSLLNVKDLAFVDPDDKIPLKTVCKFYNRQVTFVFDDTRLDLLLEEFKKGQSHMAFVQRVVNHEGQDPMHETVGLVTLEDIIEEIIQSEILDETDIVVDNRSKRRRHNPRRKDYTIFSKSIDSSNRDDMPPQLALATFQYLSTCVEPFKEGCISSTMLKRLIAQDIYIAKKYDDMSIDNLLYISGKPADYFILLLQGRCTIEIGKDAMSFECGPFTYFGSQALLIGGKDGVHRASTSSLADVTYPKNSVYVPDFTLKIVSDVQYIRIRRPQYLAALRATLLERSGGFGSSRELVRPGTLERRASNDEASMAAAAAAADSAFFTEWRRAGCLSSGTGGGGSASPTVGCGPRLSSRLSTAIRGNVLSMLMSVGGGVAGGGARNLSSSDLDNLRHHYGFGLSAAATAAALGQRSGDQQLQGKPWTGRQVTYPRQGSNPGQSQLSHGVLPNGFASPPSSPTAAPDEAPLLSSSASRLPAPLVMSTELNASTRAESLRDMLPLLASLSRQRAGDDDSAAVAPDRRVSLPSSVPSTASCSATHSNSGNGTDGGGNGGGGDSSPTLGPNRGAFTSAGSEPAARNSGDSSGR